MGKTKRNIRRFEKSSCRLKEVTEGDDTQLRNQKCWNNDSRKMKPYSSQHGKFTTEYFEGTNMRNNSQQHKLEIKNANRSLKKSYRQKLKQDLKKQIENI